MKMMVTGFTERRLEVCLRQKRILSKFKNGENSITIWRNALMHAVILQVQLKGRPLKTADRILSYVS